MVELNKLIHLCDFYCDCACLFLRKVEQIRIFISVLWLCFNSLFDHLMKARGAERDELHSFIQASLFLDNICFFLLTFLAFLLLQFSPFLENMSPFFSWLKSLFLLNNLQNDLFLVHLSCRLKMGKHPLQTSWGLCWCIIRTD